MSKKFEIHDAETAALNEPVSNKTFTIIGERSGAGTAADPSAMAFSIAGRTRPKRCPRCGTHDSIGRSARRRRWKCRVCEFEWS